MQQAGLRTPEEQRLHDEAIRLIARTRYRFFDKTTYLNPDGEKNKSAGVVRGQEQYPDIVAVEDFTGKPSIIAEIETESLVSEIEFQQWEDFASLNLIFYLYIPTSKVDDVIYVIDSEGLRDGIKGLRRYSFVNSDIEITNIW